MSQNDEVERRLESGTPVSPRLASRWFQALYETPLLFSGVLDDAGRVLDANSLSIEGCGLDRGDVIGTPFWECGWWNRDPELADRVRAWCEHALASGEPFRTRSEYYLGDGTPRTVDLSLSPLADVDEDGRAVRYLVATGSDITDAVAEADAFRRAQALFRSALDAMLDHVVIGRAVRDGDGAIVDYEIEFVNRATVEGGRRPADDLVGQRLCEMYPAWRTSSMWDVFLSVIETGVPFVGERIPYDDVARDGTPISGYWDLRVAKLGDGYITASRDVTTFVQAEQALREAEHTAEHERAAIDLLQRAALPEALPVVDGISIGAHYQAAQEQPIGGDWYDAFLLDDAHLALVIADVAGHGMDAASYMVQIRNVLRTVAFEHSQPDDILRRVNQIVVTLHAERAPMTTCCVASARSRDPPALLRARRPLPAARRRAGRPAGDAAEPTRTAARRRRRRLLCHLGCRSRTRRSDRALHRRSHRASRGVAHRRHRAARALGRRLPLDGTPAVHRVPVR